MTRDYDFNIVKCGLGESANEWNPPFTSFKEFKDDDRHNYADMISSCFEEAGADGVGIDACFDDYDEYIGDEFTGPDPIDSDPLFNTEAKRNGAKALASNFKNRYENMSTDDIISLVKKIYSVPELDPASEETAPCYL